MRLGDTNIWRFGDFQLDVRRKVLKHRDQTISMPLKELEVLSMLVRNRGELVTKRELLDEIWENAFVEESNLSRHIYLLRKTLRGFGAGDNLIENVPRRGYRFTGDVRQVDANEIVIEKHTRTRTLIEIQDESVAAPLQRNFRTNAVRYAAVVVLLAAGAALLGSGYVQSKLPETEIKSIAVLPFRTIGSDTIGSHSGIGLADVLITRLSNIRDLKVRPTSAVLKFEDQDSLSVGAKLQVDGVLEGTILYSGERVRVTARLVRTSDNTTIWTGEFEKLKAEELQLQNELALQIVKTLALNLSRAEQDAIARRHTDNADAFELYLQGRHEWNKRTGPNMIEAERLFRNAIAADPNFALAYVGLADTTAMNQSSLQQTSSAISRAIELDPDLAEAHATQGFMRMFYDRNWNAAEESFKKSLELKPNYATAHHWFATLLAIQGRNDEAKLEMHRALELDPLSYNYLADLGQIHYFAGEYAEAKRYCLKALEIYPDFAFAHQYLHYIYLKTGDHDRAIDEIIKADRIVATLNHGSARQNEELEEMENRARAAYRDGGLSGYLDHHLPDSAQEPHTFYLHAIKYAIRGENEKALDYLEKSTELGMFLSAFVKADPVFEGLRGEPRYQEILRKMGLA